jgi:mannitol operon repressor
LEYGNDNCTHARVIAGDASESREVLAVPSNAAPRSERGQVLISTGFIEEQLKDVLLAFMIDNPQCGELVEGGSAPLGTFSARIEACYALGLISEDEHNDLTLIRRIRNEFAHHIETSLDTPSVVSRCTQLRMKAEDYGDVKVGPSGQFQTASVAVITNLINRPHYVSQERRATKTWPF